MGLLGAMVEHLTAIPQTLVKPSVCVCVQIVKDHSPCLLQNTWTLAVHLDSLRICTYIYSFEYVCFMRNDALISIFDFTGISVDIESTYFLEDLWRNDVLRWLLLSKICLLNSKEVSRIKCTDLECGSICSFIMEKNPDFFFFSGLKQRTDCVYYNIW